MLRVDGNRLWGSLLEMGQAGKVERAQLYLATRNPAIYALTAPVFQTGVIARLCDPCAFYFHSGKD